MSKIRCKTHPSTKSSYVVCKCILNGEPAHRVVRPTGNRAPSSQHEHRTIGQILCENTGKQGHMSQDHVVVCAGCAWANLGDRMNAAVAASREPVPPAVEDQTP